MRVYKVQLPAMIRAYQLQYSLNRQNSLMNTAQREANRQANAAEKLFRYGNMTLDRTLRARLNAENLNDQQVQGRLAEAQNLIKLYKALGGGWLKDQIDAWCFFGQFCLSVRSTACCIDYKCLFNFFVSANCHYRSC